MSLFKYSLRRHTDTAREGCVLQTNMDEKMDDFHAECKRALWHAYAMLDPTGTDLVHVSQLRVITSNIGLKLGYDQSEEILNRDGATSMSFATYYNIIKTEILTKQEEQSKNGGKSLGERLNDVIKICWRFCSYERKNQAKYMSIDHCLMVWRLFNFLSETDDTGNPVAPVRLHCEEVGILLREFIDITGQRNKEQTVQQLLEDHKDDTLLTFTEFLDVFEKDFVTTMSRNDISLGLNELSDKYILNVLDKGMMWKRGHNVKNWKERWLVLTPTQLKYYVSKNEKVLKGTIDIDDSCKVEVLPDRPGNHPNRFVLKTSKKPYEMSAPDLKTKNQWVSDLELALEHIGKNPNIQREAAKKRCAARMEKVRLAEEEERKRKEEAERELKRQQDLAEENRIRSENEENIIKRLQEEEKRRKEAEARAQEEQLLREAEQQRLRELEEIKRELERLLEQERQAKNDEETVRRLQSQILEKEFERRAELENIKAEQEKLLAMAQEQKAELESDRQEQEQRLADAKQKLYELEREKTDAAERMKEASEKLQRAEKERHIMEEKVKLWKTPVGLARPLPVRVDPLTTHRGLGAFCAADFKRGSNEQSSQESNERSSQRLNEQSSDKSEGTNNASLTDGGHHPDSVEDNNNMNSEDIENRDEDKTNVNEKDIENRDEGKTNMNEKDTENQEEKPTNVIGEDIGNQEENTTNVTDTVESQDVNKTIEDNSDRSSENSESQHPDKVVNNDNVTNETIVGGVENQTQAAPEIASTDGDSRLTTELGELNIKSIDDKPIISDSCFNDMENTDKCNVQSSIPDGSTAETNESPGE